MTDSGFKQRSGFIVVVVCSLLMSMFIAFLNYDLPAMGIFKYYRCFAEFFSAGFAPEAHTCDSRTFPMWGFGWLLWLSSNKIVLLSVQYLLAFGATLMLFSTFRNALELDGFEVGFLRWLVLLSLPWYALHSVLWPHAIATSLLVLSICLIVDAERRSASETRQYFLAGLTFGCMLNFRSDFILFPVGLAAIILLFGKGTLTFRTVKAGAFVGTVLLMMVPWGIYTYKTTGDYLQTSTNGGHVLYISLGQLPGNSWGIVPRDEDPGMDRVLIRELGHARSSLTREADAVLKAEFLRLVAASPGEYAQKVIHNLRSMFLGGTYAGVFHEQESCRPDCLGSYLTGADEVVSQGQVARGILSGELGVRTDLEFGQYVRLGALSLSVLQSMAVVALGMLGSALLLIPSLRERNMTMLIVLAVIGYQILLSSFTFYMRAYVGSIYLLLVVVIVHVLHRLRPLRLRLGNAVFGSNTAAGS